MSKRNQNAGSRNPTRYYQNTPGGKYDGLRPGALDAETRKLLGLGVWFSWWYIIHSDVFILGVYLDNRLLLKTKNTVVK